MQVLKKNLKIKDCALDEGMTYIFRDGANNEKGHFFCVYAKDNVVYRQDKVGDVRLPWKSRDKEKIGVFYPDMGRVILDGNSSLSPIT